MAEHPLVGLGSYLSHTVLAMEVGSFVPQPCLAVWTAGWALPPPPGSTGPLSPASIFLLQQDAASCSLAAALGFSYPHLLDSNREPSLSLQERVLWGRHLAAGQLTLIQLTTAHKGVRKPLVGV